MSKRMENIGARRLQTVLTTLLEGLLYGLPDSEERSLLVDRGFVQERLDAIVRDEDLRRYIL